MRPRPPDPVVQLLFQTHLLPPPLATEAWRRAEPLLDLAPEWPPGAELLALLSSRLPELGIDSPAVAHFRGIRRHNWVAAEVALASVPEGGTGSGVVLLGRTATVAAYLPAPGMAPIGAAQWTDRFDGAVSEVRVGGRDCRVPAPAEHFVWTLTRGMWLDAVFALRHPEASWEAVATLAPNRSPRFHRRLAMLNGLGIEVPEWVLRKLRPGLVRTMEDAIRGRLAAVSRGIGRRTSRSDSG